MVAEQLHIEGKQIIGFETSAKGAERFYGINPANGSQLPGEFINATEEEVNVAVEKASTAFGIYRKKTGKEKAAFLEAIAAEIESTGDALIDICMLETGLPKARLVGERGRTVGQLRLFAALLKEGSWVNARIDTALPERQPLPRPDLRQIQIPLGPVVVFGASNFPLAFSVAGGDTASALAAGCPVIIKAHPAHPGTSEVVAKAIQRAAEATNMPDGVFSLLQTNGFAVGMALVKHPLVKAVGFTGSFAGGKALFDAAAQRQEPIPVYAEMGSINPVFVLPGAMEKNRNGIAENYSASVTLGVGQFCTNPGIMLIQKNEQASEFIDLVKDQFSKAVGGVMLNERINSSYKKAVDRHKTVKGVEVLAAAKTEDGFAFGEPILFRTKAEVFLSEHQLSEEIFGPASVIVEADSKEKFLEVARQLHGHLTATVHGTEEDLLAYADLLEILEQKVGRVVINGFPTGVEVSHAMVHGGPFPATSDGRSTSVGTTAIYRFTRPVCYQNYPQQLLPDELKNENPLQVWRLVNGEWTNSAV